MAPKVKGGIQRTKDTKVKRSCPVKYTESTIPQLLNKYSSQITVPNFLLEKSNTPISEFQATHTSDEFGCFYCKRFTSKG